MLTTAWTRQPGRFPLSRMILPFLAATFAAWAETPDDAAACAEGPASAAWAGARDSEVRARPAAVRTPAAPRRRRPGAVAVLSSISLLGGRAGRAGPGGGWCGSGDGAVNSPGHADLGAQAVRHGQPQISLGHVLAGERLLLPVLADFTGADDLALVADVPGVSGRLVAAVVDGHADRLLLRVGLAQYAVGRAVGAFLRHARGLRGGRRADGHSGTQGPGEKSECGALLGQGEFPSVVRGDDTGNSAGKGATGAIALS